MDPIDLDEIFAVDELREENLIDLVGQSVKHEQSVYEVELVVDCALRLGSVNQQERKEKRGRWNDACATVFNEYGDAIGAVQCGKIDLNVGLNRFGCYDICPSLLAPLLYGTHGLINFVDDNGINIGDIMDSEAEVGENICLACLTSCTPLWHDSPLGFETLCNECGIHFMKDERRLTEMMEAVDNYDHKVDILQEAMGFPFHHDN